ncbi:hypothetical protein [Cetobacterium sp. SF1]|uniref:hypothetical protein n=1 Tax=unclassified Cetobacterium TaxID=2630983 RepID=UPI003CECA04E
MELKQLIDELEEKAKAEKSSIARELVFRLKRLDDTLQEHHARKKVIAEIKEKNDEELLEWFRVKDI